MSYVIYIHGGMRDAAHTQVPNATNPPKYADLMGDMADHLAQDGFDGKIIEDTYLLDGVSRDGVSVKMRIPLDEKCKATYTTICHVWQSNIADDMLCARKMDPIEKTFSARTFAKIWARIKAEDSAGRLC